jgi:hypothetical protein
MKVTLSLYSIRVRFKWERDSFLELDSFDDKSDFFEVAKDFFKGILSVQKNDAQAQQVLTLSKIEDKKRSISGILHAGEYGLACDVVDVDTADVVFKKTKKNADMLPFYFRLEVPRDANEAILIMQKSSHIGIKTSFTALLDKYFALKYEEFKLDIDPLFPKELVEKHLRKGHVSEIRFTKIGIPKDLADASAGGGHKETKGVMKLIIRAQKGKFLSVGNRIKKFLDTPSTKGSRGFYELKESQFEADKVQLKVNINGKPRLVDLDSLHSSPLYDVTDDITFGDDGNPQYDSINTAAEKLAKEVRASMYGEAKGDE